MRIKKHTTESFINKAKWRHGADKYDYSKTVYTHMKDKVVLKHNLCGSWFEQMATNHLRGDGCPVCKKKIKRKPRVKLTFKNLQDFIQYITKNQKGDEYDYSLIKEITPISKDIPIIHKKCGKVFYQSARLHEIGCGCSHCFNFKNMGRERFIQDCEEKFGKDEFDFSETEYKIGYKKTKIKHNKCGRSFVVAPLAFKKGTGCPYCSSGPISSISQEWLNYVGIPDKLGVTREVRIKIGNKSYVVDGFDPETNTVYEFHGDFFHGNPKIYDPDALNKLNKKKFGELFETTCKRSQAIRNAGYDLISIWESEWKEQKKKLLK